MTALDYGNAGQNEVWDCTDLELRWRTLPATSRHIGHTLWLLPSGPDQVNVLLLREDQ